MTTKLHAIIIILLFLCTTAVARAEVLGAYPPMFLIQAEQDLESGNTAHAIELLNRRYKRLRAPEDRIRGLAVLCRAYLLEKNLRPASWACDQATDMDLADWSDFNNRGVVELHLGQFDDALGSFERSQSLNPKAQSVANNIARTRAIRENERLSSAH